MSFGSGFGGFGSNTQSSGFGGFGSNNSTTTGAGFGSTGFGANKNTTSTTGTTSGGIFGNATGGFGTTGGFGANNTPSLFSSNANKGFGSTATTTSGGIFGSGTSTSGSGFGGFGSNTTTSGFGSNSGSNMFGQNKTGAFGSGTTGNSIFGTGGGFGSTNATASGFGSPGVGTALNSGVPPCEGTGSTPFQAHTDKDGAIGNQTTNHYQSITCMPPYQKYSFEELRLADYVHGRKFGNSSGQAGAFGQSTGFGGFGTSTTGSGFGSGGMFSNNNTSGSTFGTNTATSGFGSSNIFGNNQSKPSLFGPTTTTSQQSGGIFGTSNTAGTTGFGSGGGFGSGASTGTTGGLFGSGNNTQNKGFSFGTNTSNTGGGMFGGGSTGTGFGSQNTTTSSFGGFGSNQTAQQNQSSSIFGGNGFGGTANTSTTTGLFGSKPATSSTTGIFGGNQQTGTGLFGNTTNNQQTTGGGLFANTQQKPGGIFGNTNTTTGNAGTGSGLFSGFGNNAQNQNQTSSIFGGNTSNKSGGLFSNSTTGTGLFGNTSNTQTNTQAGGSLFGGNANNTQQQSSSLFGTGGSYGFGNSQQQNQQTAPQQPSFNTSVIDPTAYGNQSIFSVVSPQQSIPGPIATPLSASTNRAKKASFIPQYKVNPSVTSRLLTPQKRSYGLGYSVYGTPSNINSPSTPGVLANGLLGSNIAKNLSKSLSATNLRRTFDSDTDSILTPGAFSAGSGRYGNSSLKRLTIDKNLRTDLFDGMKTPPLPGVDKEASKPSSKLKKKVSFDSASPDRAPAGALIRTETDGISPAQSTALNASTNGETSHTSASRTDDAQAQRKDTPAVQEKEPRSSVTTSNSKKPNGVPLSFERKLGEYYMKPSRAELDKMSRDQLKHIENFVVGRKGCGYVTFDEPVDLTTVPLDRIFDDLAQIKIRQITVYPDDKDKPQPGKGLNVPSTLYLENSWPRGYEKRPALKERNDPAFAKHLKRLQKVTGTEFISYNSDTGVWIFRVPHFTTYGLDYSSDEDDEEEEDESSENTSDQSAVSASLDTSTPTLGASHRPNTTNGVEKSIILPGAFDEENVEDEEMDDETSIPEGSNTESFLGNRSVGSPSEDLQTVSVESSHNEMVENNDDSLNMAGSFPEPGHPMEPFGNSVLELQQTPPNPRSILKPTRRQSLVYFSTPPQELRSGDWVEQLQRTISPRKQDRKALRASQGTFLDRLSSRKEKLMRPKSPLKTIKDFSTSIDLMNSLFGQDQSSILTAKPSIDWPYEKQTKTIEQDMSEMEKAFHESFKPKWHIQGRLLYSFPTFNKHMLGYYVQSQKPLGSDFLIGSETLKLQEKHTDFQLSEGVPQAQFKGIQFDQFSHLLQSKAPHLLDEKYVWDLAHILFDEYEDDISKQVPFDLRTIYRHRILKDRFSRFWERLVAPSVEKAIAAATSAEEKAIIYLSGHDIQSACSALSRGKDYRLATLVAQIGGDQIMRDDLRQQIDEWRRLNVLSEMTDHIRALYEMLAGNTCTCLGKTGPLEDQASTFTISERFQLDWKRSFGLRLWYGIFEDDHLDAAILQYSEDLDSGIEHKKPVPWFVEQGVMLASNSSQDRESILWGLLKAFVNPEPTVPELSSIFMAENISPNALDSRLGFQLLHSLGGRLIQHPFPSEMEVADRLALNYASECEFAGDLERTIFVLLHISEPNARKKAIQSTLAHFADRFPERSEAPFNLLVGWFKIPEAWIWEAKALYARSALNNHIMEVDFLLHAENWDQAHKVLCQEVAPKAIIEQDYAVLRQLLSGFKAKENVADWNLGGQVFLDYLTLIDGKDYAITERVLKRLADTLPVVATKSHVGFEEMVAIREMSGVVGSRVLEIGLQKASTSTRLLKLPFTEDACLRHTLDLSLTFYRSVMAGRG